MSFAGDTTSSSRQLKVGLVFEGRVVDEAFVPPGEPVSVGTRDDGNTVAFPAEGTPEKEVVLDWVGDAWELCEGGYDGGRLQMGAEVLHLGGRDARSTDDVGLVPDEEASGRLDVGRLTVVFRAIDRPDDPAPPELPGDVEAGPTGVLDGTTKWVLALSVLMVGLVTAGFEFGSWPQLKQKKELKLEHVRVDREGPDPKDFEMMSDVEPPTGGESAESEPSEEPSEPSPDDSDGTESETSPAPSDDETTSDASPSNPSDAPPPPSDESPRRNVSDSEPGDSEPMPPELANQLDETVDDVVGHEGDGDDEIAAAFDEASPSNQRTGSGGNIGTAVEDSDDDGRAVGGGELSRSDGTRRAEEHRARASRDGGVTVSTPQTLEPEEPEQFDRCLDRQAISQAVQRQTPGIQNCYERELKKDRSKGGKISVAVTVGADGTVERTSVERDDVGGSVASCVQRRLGRMNLANSCSSETTTFEKSFVFSPNQ